MIEERQEDVSKCKHRVDFRFYSNVVTINVTEADAHFDFSQFPSENNELSTVRIFLSHALLKNLHELLNNIPQLQEEKK
jgi:hypothetical protein